MSEEAKPYRSDSIYVSWQTRKCLSYVPRDADENIDGLADKILSDWVKANHPKVVEHVKSQYETDQTFKKAYTKAPF